MTSHHAVAVSDTDPALAATTYQPTIFDVIARDYPHVAPRHSLEQFRAAAASIGVRVHNLKPNLSRTRDHEAEAAQGWRHLGLVVLDTAGRTVPVSQAVPSAGLSPATTVIRAVQLDNPQIEPVILSLAHVCVPSDTGNLAERFCDTWIASLVNHPHVPAAPEVTDLPTDGFSVTDGERFVAAVRYEGHTLTLLTTAPPQPGRSLQIYARYWMDTDVHAFPAN
jgi:hypothetical protein